jgi:hypothetical protein
MTKGSEAKEPKHRLLSGKYRQVQVASLEKGRKGKHHQLVAGILDELRTAKAGAALVIPLGEVGGIGLANLRSAVHRAAASAGIKIQTLADDTNFYVWASESKKGREVVTM